MESDLQMLQLINYANLYKNDTQSGHLDVPYIAQFQVLTVFASLLQNLALTLNFTALMKENAHNYAIYANQL